MCPAVRRFRLWQDHHIETHKWSLRLYAPAGVVLLIAAAVFIPEMLLSFRIVNKYGSERNRIYNNSVSSVVEYITGIQTLRAYSMTGVKN